MLDNMDREGYLYSMPRLRLKYNRFGFASPVDASVAGAQIPIDPCGRLYRWLHGFFYSFLCSVWAAPASSVKPGCLAIYSLNVTILFIASYVFKVKNLDGQLRIEKCRGVASLKSAAELVGV